ncbi:LacI family transcriptional regulator [Neiella marina]|uniref:LacI family transcriptional regulator n=1 Tax=Neiella marina TaxID=508461 RepID=A0A8J2U2N7_9GAMM|nr:substrate-binding domain-containing protein [Neiella marina]GGA66898.1 LacI family transcriptional regulator [Neiella marina]
MKKKSSTIYDVARLAGVSPSTVTRFLNRTTYVSEEKSERIEDAVKKTGYKPSFQMQQDLSRRSMTIGLLLQHPDSPYTSTIVNDMEKTLISKGYSLVMSSGHWQNNIGNHAVDYLTKSNVDGIIIITGNLDNQKILATAKQLPVVTVGYDIEGDNICSLNLDNVMGGYIATLHLLQQGHTNIAHIGGISSQPDAIARFDGYKRALGEASIPINSKLVKSGDFGMESGYSATKDLIESRVYFSAIFAANDLTAYGAIKALHDNGLKVPEDVSVLGFDDLPTSKYFTPALTTLRQPIEEIGTMCANSILSMVLKGQYEARVPPIDLIIRQSTKSIW